MSVLPYIKQKYVIDKTHFWDDADCKRLFTHLRNHDDDRAEYHTAVDIIFKGRKDYCGDHETITDWLDTGCDYDCWGRMETACRDTVLTIAELWLERKNISEPVRKKK